MAGSALLRAFAAAIAAEHISADVGPALGRLLQRGREAAAEPELEFRRSRVLAERAAFRWAAVALEASGHRERAYGLLTLQVGGHAAIVAFMLRSRYTNGLEPDSDVAGVCGHAADALDQAVGLGSGSRPDEVHGCGVAAGKCLAALGRLELGTDVADEADRAATQLLDRPLAAWLSFE